MTVRADTGRARLALARAYAQDAADAAREAADAAREACDLLRRRRDAPALATLIWDIEEFASASTHQWTRLQERLREIEGRQP